MDGPSGEVSGGTSGGVSEPQTPDLPVAEVAVDVPLAHLDRPFEYAVPPEMDGAAGVGTRVRVRFAGQDVEGFVLARKAVADHGGRLAPLRRVVSEEPVLDEEMLGTARAVADHYGGTLADVLRLAVPRRHATAEGAATLAVVAAAKPPPEPATDAWTPYPAGPALLRRLRDGEPLRAVWTALPGTSEPTAWPTALAQAASAVLAGGRGALLVVPDHRDLARVDAALTAALGSGHHVRLSADQGPSARYRAWLALRRGDVRVVVGTRAAMFAPVTDLGLLAVWDDGDDNHAEPHAPYPQVREVLALRAARSDAALLVGALARSVEAQQWVEQGFARAVEPQRSALRAAAPRVLLPGGDVEAERDPAAVAARLPSLAWRTASAGLAGGGRDHREPGPVLVQVPRRGYLLTLACQQCRARARCRHCGGPLALAGADAPPTCRWCSRADPGWRCEECGSPRLRSGMVGARRTAEELGRAFPGVPVRRSGAGEVISAVGPEPALVIATPGAEPVAEGGYAAALLLDAWALLDRADLRAGEEALRRWMDAAGLVRGARAGGVVVLLAAAGLDPVEALVRWDPARLAASELAGRAALSLPPAAAMAQVSGAPDGVAALLGHLDAPTGTEVIGPVPVEAPVRRPAAGTGSGGPGGRTPEPSVSALLRVPREQRAALAAALRAAASTRSARKDAAGVRVQMDPVELL